MLLANLYEAKRYYSHHPLFERAFQFLINPENHKLAPARYPLDGDKLYAVVAETPGRGTSGTRLEVHRKYIDIQYVVSGTDVIGFRPLAECTKSDGVFDEASDVAFYRDSVVTRITLNPGMFAVFYPGDAHAPGGGIGIIRKIVIKVLI